ncbi:MAG: ABC transporter substrate-binding protein [Thermomicrobiales bacterium]|nr:ABC transporter substrate-binding protein [Thermomicrobiales bacterium]
MAIAQRPRVNLLSRRSVLAGSTAALASVILPHAATAQTATPLASPAAGDDTTRNPWEPEWSPDPDLFTVLARTADTVTVRTAADGDIELPANPQRVVAVFGEEDILIALGLADRVVAIAGFDGVPEATPQLVVDTYLPPDVTMISSWEIDQEAILALQPDLVIGVGADWTLSDEVYASLSQRVPVLRTPVATMNFPRGALHSYGALFGREDEAAARIAALDAFAAEGRAHIAPVVGDKKLLVIFYQGTYNALGAWEITPEGLAISGSVFTSPFFRELGMRQTDYMDTLSVEANRAAADVFEISLEQVGLIDADIVFVPTVDPEETEREFLGHPVLKTLPASQNDMVFAFPFTEVSGGYYGTRRAIALAVELLTGEEMAWLG